VNAFVFVLGMYNKIERDIYSVGVNALVFVLGMYNKIERGVYKISVWMNLPNSDVIYCDVSTSKKINFFF